ncbi:MAG: hypothetical protein RL119_1658 [Actinomycetota bacterium]
MTVNVALSAAATLVALAFAISTFDRWLRRRRPYDGAWTVSLTMFAIASGALWWAQARGWSLGSFRIFFLFGAILNVPWLALGTVYLLFGARFGDHDRHFRNPGFLRRDPAHQRTQAAVPPRRAAGLTCP